MTLNKFTKQKTSSSIVVVVQAKINTVLASLPQQYNKGAS